MRASLLQAGYSLDPSSGVWTASERADIAYSDGDEVEERIRRAIALASDRSVLSQELKSQISDWPSLYHLSPLRANVVRPFASALGGTVLEIGAGCGAITRHLAEMGAQVLALEGTYRRASIARLRTEGFENVEVVAERFDDFTTPLKFDAITLIGVLEYAALFTSAENPAQAMLQRLREMLKPEGVLVLAIENKLGLKYFAGSPEDHLGRPMIGLEGRYQDREVRTYGRVELQSLLEQAGFGDSAFHAPFPDYKFPVSILAEEALTDSDFDAAVFAMSTARLDPQLADPPCFAPELVWREAIGNGLGRHLANSFVVRSSPLPRASLAPAAEDFAWHFSANRLPGFCKQTVFSKLPNGSIEVKSFRLKPAESAVTAGELISLRQVIDSPVRYSRGVVFSTQVVSLLTTDRWTRAQLGKLLGTYCAHVERIAGQDGSSVVIDGPRTALPGRYIDLVFGNLLVDEEKAPVFFDREWVGERPIEMGFLLARSLLGVIAMVSRFGAPADGPATPTRADLVREAFTSLGWPIDDDDLKRFAASESAVQEAVTGRVTTDGGWLLDRLLPMQNFLERGREALTIFDPVRRQNDERGRWIEKLEKDIDEKNAAERHSREQCQLMKERFDEASLALSETRRHLERTDQDRQAVAAELAAVNASMTAIHQSRSWRFVMLLQRIHAGLPLPLKRLLKSR